VNEHPSKPLGVVLQISSMKSSRRIAEIASNGFPSKPSLRDLIRGLLREVLAPLAVDVEPE